MHQFAPQCRRGKQQKQTGSSSRNTVWKTSFRLRQCFANYWDIACCTEQLTTWAGKKTCLWLQSRIADRGCPLAAASIHYFPTAAKALTIFFFSRTVRWRQRGRCALWLHCQLSFTYAQRHTTTRVAEHKTQHFCRSFPVRLDLRK